jgi:hypothetical protein
MRVRVRVCVCGRVCMRCVSWNHIAPRSTWHTLVVSPHLVFCSCISFFFCVSFLGSPIHRLAEYATLPEPQSQLTFIQKQTVDGEVSTSLHRHTIPGDIE